MHIRTNTLIYIYIYIYIHSHTFILMKYSLNIVTVLWSTPTSPFTHQLFVCFGSVMVHSEHIKVQTFLIRLRCTFKLYMEWSNAQSISAPSTTISTNNGYLPTWYTSHKIALTPIAPKVWSAQSILHCTCFKILDILYIHCICVQIYSLICIFNGPLSQGFEF